MKIYAGIGSRKTPPDILYAMTEIAIQLEAKGWKLRSGHAHGADQAFERGVSLNKEIHLPWSGYNGGIPGRDGCIVPEFNQAIYDITAAHHPVWNQLSGPVQELMYRNTTIVLGETGHDPVSMISCWTEGAKGKGGTGHALRIAKTFQIPVFDLADRDQQKALCELHLD